MNVLGTGSAKKLLGVDPRLVVVVMRALQKSPIDFSVICGPRTLEEQGEIRNNGQSWTSPENSKHIPTVYLSESAWRFESVSLCHAVDLAAWVDGAISWEPEPYVQIAREAVFPAVEELGIAVRWGGDWNGSGDWRDEVQRGTFDGGHWELV